MAAYRRYTVHFSIYFINPGDLVQNRAFANKNGQMLMITERTLKHMSTMKPVHEQLQIFPLKTVLIVRSNIRAFGENGRA